MKKSNNCLLIIILPLLILSCWGDSSPTSDKSKSYQVSGSVTDKNEMAIEGVTVQIIGTNLSSSDTTGTDGAFVFENIKTGNYLIKAYKDSCFFKPSKFEFAVNKSDVNTLNFVSAKNYIHGRVLDIMTDEGYKGARVDLGIASRFGGSIVYVDSFITGNNGEYEFFDNVKNDNNEFYVNFKSANLNNIGVSHGNYQLESNLFKNHEVIVPAYYFSSEKLQITKIQFSEETKILSLEWTPSKSSYLYGYTLLRKKLPYHYADATDYYQTNSVSININSDYVKRSYGEDTISGPLFFVVKADYMKDNKYFDSQGSEAVNIQLSW